MNAPGRSKEGEFSWGTKLIKVKTWKYVIGRNRKIRGFFVVGYNGGFGHRKQGVGQNWFLVLTK